MEESAQILEIETFIPMLLQVGDCRMASACTVMTSRLITVVID